jgi:hypothetical protein
MGQTSKEEGVLLDLSYYLYLKFLQSCRSGDRMSSEQDCALHSRLVVTRRASFKSGLSSYPGLPTVQEKLSRVQYFVISNGYKLCTGKLGPYESVLHSDRKC